MKFWLWRKVKVFSPYLCYGRVGGWRENGEVTKNTIVLDGQKILEIKDGVKANNCVSIGGVVLKMDGLKNFLQTPSWPWLLVTAPLLNFIDITRKD